MVSTTNPAETTVPVTTRLLLPKAVKAPVKLKLLVFNVRLFAVVSIVTAAIVLVPLAFVKSILPVVEMALVFIFSVGVPEKLIFPVVTRSPVMLVVPAPAIVTVLNVLPPVALIVTSVRVKDPVAVIVLVAKLAVPLRLMAWPLSTKVPAVVVKAAVTLIGV